MFLRVFVLVVGRVKAMSQGEWRLEVEDLCDAQEMGRGGQGRLRQL